MTRRGALLLAWLLLAGGGARTRQAAFGVSGCLAEGIEAVTRPSQDVTLSFVRPGRVSKVMVKDGDQVKAGQVLIQQDDQAEQLQLVELKAQADDTTRIRAAEAQLAQKQVDLKKIEWAAARGASTELEVEHAKLEVTIAELSLELSKFQQKQDRLKYEQAQAQVDRMKLVSPLDGRAEKVEAHEGQNCDAQEKVIRLVKVESLWIDVPVPLGQARQLKLGDLAAVEFPATGQAAATGTGKVIYIAAVADAPSGTLAVRVEAPNPERRPAGEHVKVNFPSSSAGQTGKEVTGEASKKERTDGG